MAGWVDLPLGDVAKPLVPGHKYQLQFHFPVTISAFYKALITSALKGAAGISGKATVDQVTYAPMANTLGKANGSLVIVDFTAIGAANVPSESGFDVRAVILVLTALIFGILAVNGTLFKFAESVDNTTAAAKNLFNPATLLLLIVGFLLILPLFRKG